MHSQEPVLPNVGPPDLPSANSPDRPRIIRSQELLLGQREVWIEHRNELYRLRVTANGRLYLTK